MRPKFSWILISVLGFLVFTALCAAKDESPSSGTLLSQARSRELWAEGTPAVMMRGRIEVAGVNGTVAPGDYAVDWVSPSKWREEILFANYQRMRIRDANGYWQKATLDYQPYLMYQLTGLLDVKTALRVLSIQTLGKVKKRQRAGIQQTCVDVNAGKRPEKRTDHVLCFDDTGALIAIEYPQGDTPIPPEVSRIEYRDFRSIAGKLIPFERQALKDGKTVASLKITEVKELSPINPAEFSPPSDAEMWPQCDDMQEAAIKEVTQTNYPPAAIINREKGRVMLYGVIETDGTLSHLTVIKGVSELLNGASIEAARQWRYTPAQCGGKPIRSELSAYTEFWPLYY